MNTYAMWSPNFHFPLSGDVEQEIEPRFTTPIAGVAEIEGAIVHEVASYGRQLGALTDAVLALSAASGQDDGPEVSTLRAMADEIAAKKTAMREVLHAHAEAALTRLKSADPEAWQALLTAQQTG
ncbi:MAG: hypothetical protein AAFR46_08325 [Pseudomonadota bacterium]